MNAREPFSIAPNWKPSKFLGVMRITLGTYFYTCSACLVLAGFKYLKDNFGQGEPLWSYFAFAFGVPVVATLLMWFVFLWESRFRKSDPYRLSRIQFRFFAVPFESFVDIRSKLESLGYRVEVKGDLDRPEIIATRIRPINLDRFHEKRYGAPHIIKVEGIRNGTTLEIQVMGKSVGKFVLNDFKSTVYDSLEEIVDELGWRTYLRTKP